MGGTLSNIFKGGADASTGDKIAGGAIQGGLKGFGQSMQPQPSPSPSAAVYGPGPAPTQVDPSFFAPTNFGGFSPQERQLVGGSSGRSAFYGGQ